MPGPDTLMHNTRHPGPFPWCREGPSCHQMVMKKAWFPIKGVFVLGVPMGALGAMGPWGHGAMGAMGPWGPGGPWSHGAIGAMGPWGPKGHGGRHHDVLIGLSGPISLMATFQLAKVWPGLAPAGYSGDYFTQCIQ